MTFCVSPNCTNACGRKLTEQVRKDARKWWGSDDAPIAVSNFCEETVRSRSEMKRLITMTGGFFTEDDFPGFEKPMSYEHRLDCAIRANEKIQPIIDALHTISKMRAYKEAAKDMKALAKRTLKEIK